MKNALILLLGFGILAACNNNKDKGLTDKKNYQTDDYRNNSGENNNGNNNNGNNSSFNNGGSWSSSDVRSFNAECLKQLNGNEEVANKFCPCFLEKLQTKYSSFDDMNKNSTEEEGTRYATQCKQELGMNDNNTGNNNGNNNNYNNNNGGQGWTEAERSAFVNSCASNAIQGGMTSRQAQNYCSCMQQKIEQALPNSADAAKLTEADMDSPEMKRLINGCLQQN